MPQPKHTDSPRPLSDTPLDGEIPQVPHAQRGQYRAALLGVYLASRPGLGQLLPPELRPQSLPSAIRTIKGLRGELRDRATRVATAELCVGLYNRRLQQLRPNIVDLVGKETAERLFTYEKLAFSVNKSAIKRAVYDVLSGKVPAQPIVEDGWEEEPPESRGHEEREREPLVEQEPEKEPPAPKPIVEEQLRKPPSPKARRAPLQAGPAVQTDTELDVATMVTSVTSKTVGNGDFSELAKFADPQSWTYSPFWREAYKVIRVGGRFVKDPNPPPLGTPWEGYFYEYVEWDWNGGVLSSFQNYLNVIFSVTPDEINLTYSLYNCRGSMLYARVAEGGIDVDAGIYHAEADFTVIPTEVAIIAKKSLRYTPIVSRSTGNQGTVLTAELLNFMAPGIVGLWIDDLIYESTLLWENS